MDEQNYIVRISSRFNTDSDWLAIDPVLLLGEVAFVAIKSDIPNSLPEIRLKSGDGVHKYSELPFISANAMDVYEWAKQKKKPTYRADEIIGLENFKVKHTHSIDDIIGLRDILENGADIPDIPVIPDIPDDDEKEDTGTGDGSSNGDNPTDGEGDSNDAVETVSKIIANSEDGLYAIQEGNDYIIGIDKNITFTLDGGDSSQFRS